MDDKSGPGGPLEEKSLDGEPGEIIDLVDVVFDDDDGGEFPEEPEPLREAPRDLDAPPGDPEAQTGEDVALSEKQVEQALERVIRNIFQEKIEGMLVQAVEKTVEKEIERISALLKSVVSEQEK
ncbi:hypothetical protein EPICR_60034 [Candidatus Desulfarcum epimagneticum]|uniref:Uncharacterized protein n=1 Tax=uncultured Desulfobacteraceae bacterium TaxID=218296 RepID=A0A484HQA1_9BACT|nr:hypothetical protein EPICR_60034 [uncultured Desulfobacteraceae bacterium]